LQQVSEPLREPSIQQTETLIDAEKTVADYFSSNYVESEESLKISKDNLNDEKKETVFQLVPDQVNNLTLFNIFTVLILPFNTKIND